MKGGRKIILNANGWLWVVDQDGAAIWGFDPQS